jgi:hypothetical protein
MKKWQNLKEECRSREAPASFGPARSREISALHLAALTV